MNKEIKEILKYIDQFVYTDQTYNDIKLSKIDVKLILDYITNLQEELENKAYEQLKTQCFLYKDEVDRLNNTLKDIKEYFNKRKEEYSNCKSKNNINYIHYGQLLCDLQRIIDKN